MDAFTVEIAQALRRSVEQAVNELPAAEKEHLRSRGSHLVCGLLADAVEALVPLAEADVTIGQAVAEAVLPRNSGISGALSKALLKDIVSRLVQDVAQVAFAKVQAMLKAMRLAAVFACPDPVGHAAVREKCLAPLMGEGTEEIATSFSALSAV